MIVQIWSGRWTELDVMKRPKWLFLFGDNVVSSGKRGQAVIRDCSNSFGIVTKKYPSLKDDAFLNDDELVQNQMIINICINSLYEIIKSKKYDVLVVPENGFGTGLAKLPSKAPKTFDYLKHQLNSLFDEITPGVSTIIRW